MSKFLMFFFLISSVFGKTILLTPQNSISINDTINVNSMNNAKYQLLQLCKAPANDDIYLVLNSPGGDVLAGLSFISFVKGLPCKVHTISIFSASMAYQIVQNLDTRYAMISSTLMSHRMSLSDVSGQVPGELISKIGYFKQVSTELNKVVADRVGISLSSYERLIYDELWLTGTQAQDSNHIDEIVNVRCSDSLKGFVTGKIETYRGYEEVKFSKCPLLTKPLMRD